MSKFNTKRYAEYMKALNIFFTNDLFSSMLPSENKRPAADLAKDIKSMTLDEILLNAGFCANILSGLDYKSDPVNSSAEAEGRKHEEMLENLFDEAKKRFTEYKKNHNDFVGDDYRKYEYLTNISYTFSLQQNELNNFKIYNPDPDSEEIDAAVLSYKSAQDSLEKAISEFNEFQNSPDYNASFISPEQDDIFKEKGINGETILEAGINDVIKDADTVLAELKDSENTINKGYRQRIAEAADARDKKISATKKLHAEKIALIREKHEKAIAELEDKQNNLLNENGKNISQARSDYYDAINSINEIHISDVSKSIVCGGMPAAEGEQPQDWIEKLKGSRNADIADRRTLVVEKQNKIKAEITETKEMISAAALNLNSIKAQIKAIDKDVKNVEKSDEYKKLQSEAKNIRNDLAEIDRLYKQIDKGGLLSADKNLLDKYGINYNEAKILNQEKTENAEIDAFNKLNEYFSGNNVGRDLAGNIKELFNALYAKKGNDSLVENDCEKYAEENDGRLPIDIDKLQELIYSELFLDMDNIKGFRGTLKSKEEAASLKKLIGLSAELNELAGSCSQDAPDSVKRFAKALSGTVVALNNLRMDASFASILNLAGMNEVKGYSETMQENAFAVLYRKEKELKTKSIRLDEKLEGDFKREKIAELRNKQKILTDGLNKAQDNINELNASLQQKTSDLNYLKKADNLIIAIGTLNEAERQSAGINNQYQDVRNRITEAEKQYSEDIDSTDLEYENSLKEADAEYSKSEKDLKEYFNRNAEPCIEEADAVRNVKNKLVSLKFRKDNLVEAAKQYSNAITKFRNNCYKAEKQIAGDKAKAIDHFIALESIAFGRFIKSPKTFGGNSKYFDNVVTAIKSYQKAADASPEELTLAENNLRNEINTYINERDTGKLKSTAGGQIRIDTANQIISMLDQKAAVCEAFDEEAALLKTKAASAKSIEIQSELEAKLLKRAKADELADKKDFLKKINVKPIRTSEQILNEFKPLIQSVNKAMGEGDTYLTKLTELCIRRLGSNNQAFLEAVAAVFTANFLSGCEPKVKNNTNVIDSTLHSYMKAPVVKDYAAKLISGELKPEDFVAEAAKPETMKFVKTQDQSKSLGLKAESGERSIASLTCELPR